MLRNVEEIAFIQFDDRDVVRHNLVQKIVKAYERYNEIIGANRQLSLKLSEPRQLEPAVEPAPSEAAPETRPA